MRYLTPVLTLLLTVLILGASRAEQEDSQPAEREDRGAKLRQRILEEFDADGDGEMNDEERTTAREEMHSRRRDRQGGDGDADGRRRRDNRRGPQDQGPPNPSKLFDHFDADGDEQLSREEFLKLTEAVQKMRERFGHGEGRPGLRRFREARRDTPPDESNNRQDTPPPERRFKRPEPFQNPSNRPKGEAREGRRGRRGPEGEGRRFPDAGPPQPRGPEGRGPERRHPPDPAEVFDRFDLNGDDRLSREEFMNLAKTMRERTGQGGPAEKRFRRDRGDRPGPKEGRGPQRRDRRRPPRPEREGAGLAIPEAQDDTA